MGVKVKQVYLFAPHDVPAGASLDADTRLYTQAGEFGKNARVHAITVGLTADPGTETLECEAGISDAQGNLNVMAGPGEITNREFLSWQEASGKGLPLPRNGRFYIDCKAATAAVTTRARFMLLISYDHPDEPSDVGI